MKKKCNGKTKGLAIQYIFHDCFEDSTEICIQSIFHDCLNLHKEKAYVFFHYWRSQEPPVSLRCGEFRSSFLKKCIVFRNEKNATVKQRVWRYIFHDFLNTVVEICIQYIFHDCLNLHKENAHVVFHYWRSQEPPVSHRCGEFRSSVLKKCIVFDGRKNLQR